MTSTNADPDALEGDRETSLPEKVAGRYVVRRLLGRGGFGAVYEAFDEVEDRSIALKLIRRDGAAGSRSGRVGETHQSASPAFSGTRRSVTRSFGGHTPSSLGDNLTQAFKDEFRLLTQLHHPNLATVYDFGRCPGIDGLYFTQELVRGTDLTTFCSQAGRDSIVEVLVQLARALDYLHALGFIHGDIKPSNILVLESEVEGGPHQAKLIDFGLARMLRKPQAPDEAAVDDEDGTVVLGTPGFSAPEKVKGQAGDGRSDIYSLAATLYAAVRGQRPFPGKTFRETLRAQRDWRPELAGAILQPCGPVVAEVIGRMLEPNPEKRPQSARSIVLELLRREAGSLRDREQNALDRREFARVLVEHLPFVDRAHYLELLLEKATVILRPDATPSEASSSRPGMRGLIRTIAVEAPEGMGKHRLMAELRREIQLGDGLFIEGSCWSSDHSALGPFAAVVVQLAAARGEKDPVVRQFADLVALARDRKGSETAAQQLSEFLIACASDRPFVLHLSDLSHAHESTRITYEQLCRAIDHSEASLLLCATTEPHTKLTPVLQRLNRDQLTEIWHLRPFTQREMLSILQAVLGEGAVLRELISMLDKLTGGHPLSFRETLRVLIEEGILIRDADNWSLRTASAAAEHLHKTLAQHSESRLDGLGVSSWEIGSILYLLEAPIEERQLADLSDLRRERFIRTLDRLEGEGLVVRNPTSGSSMVSLAHESVREAVRLRYQESLDETRLDLAERIEDVGNSDPNFVFLRARLLDEASEGLEAVDDLEQAADHLFAAGQPQLAAYVLERLIRRLRRHGRTATLDRLLRVKLKLLEHGAGAIEDRQREASLYESGVLVAELLGDHRAEALFWLGLADRYTSQGMEAVLARLNSAAAAAEQTDDRVLSLRIANRRAEVLLAAGEVEKASHWSREAMKIIELDEASDVERSHIVGVRLRCLSLSGQIAEGRRLHDLSKPIAARVQVVHRTSYLSGIAFLAALSGDPQRAIPETELAIDELRSANLPRLLFTPLHNLGDLKLRNNDLPGAEEAFREAVRLSGLYGFDFHVFLNRGFLGYVLARLGDVEEGADILAEAKKGMSGIPGEHLSLQQLRLLDAEVAHMLGQSARARRELEEMLADFQTTNELSLAHWAQEALARIEHDLGTTFIETPTIVDDSTDPDQDTVETVP